MRINVTNPAQIERLAYLKCLADLRRQNKIGGRHFAEPASTQFARTEAAQLR